MPKYSDILNALRIERGIRGEFNHNLVSIDSSSRIATFKKSDGTEVQTDYSLLHVTPQMGPPKFIADSPLADSVGWVSVHDATLQHKNPEYSNVFALGDCSSLPTSKTAAAISAQAPVLTDNVFKFMETGKVGNAAYDGYTSCPVREGVSSGGIDIYKFTSFDSSLRPTMICFWLNLFMARSLKRRLINCLGSTKVCREGN